MIRSHTWGPRGVTNNTVVNTSRGHNVTMILAIYAQNIVHSEAVVGVGVNGDLFKQYLLELVNIHETETRSTLVLDNVRFHHVDDEFKEKNPYE